MTFPSRLNLTVTIGGVDVTSYIRPSSFKINNVLTSLVDTMECVLETANGLDLSDWQEVIVLDGTTRIFGGFLQDSDGRDGENIDVNKDISASDYSVRFGKVTVREAFIDMSDKEILEYLNTHYLDGEDYDFSTYVSTIKTYERKQFNRKTLLDVIQNLAKTAKAEWYVDYNKNLRFFERDTAATDAPYYLTDDSPDMVNSFPYNDFSFKQDGSGVVNRVEIVGGKFRSDDTTFYLAGTGQDNRISIPFKLHAPDGESSILVYRNDGSESVPVWTPMTVLVGYIDSLATTSEVLYYFNEKVVEQKNNWTALSNAVKITAKQEIPLRTRVQDHASYEHYGMYFDDVIVDTSITDKATARMTGLARLAECATVNEAITLKVDEPGLRAGQIVTVINTRRGLNSEYTVQKVNCVAGVNGRAFYKINLGTYDPSLIDLMLTLARNTKQSIAWSDEEVLDEVLQVAEEVHLTEVKTVDYSTQPYYFSDAPEEAFIWGFGTFDPVA